MLRVAGLSFTYPLANRPAVEDLDFEVKEGEIFGLLGPSGAGKSTTLGVLIGLLKGWCGQVDVMGRSLDTWGGDYYERIGVSFETPNHFLKLTAGENLAYFRSLYSSPTKSADEVLELVGLQKQIDVRVGEFSKGMKNRLTFARSLLHEPKLWFLDEPTAGLDPVNARNVREIIGRRNAEGATVVLSTHNMQLADDLCDRVGFIVDGRISVVESPETLKHRHGQETVRVIVESREGTEEHTFDLQGLADNDEFLAALRQPLHSIHSEETTLDEVFIRVTGQRLHDT